MSETTETPDLGTATPVVYLLTGPSTYPTAMTGRRTVQAPS